MKKGELIGLVALALGVFGLAAFFLWSPQASRVGNGPVDVGGGGLFIANQEDLNTVHVDVTLAAAGFVTIHENFGSAPGAIIGTSVLLAPGTYKDVSIDLSTPMKHNYQYIGLLQADNGDGYFKVDDDMPVKTNGVVVRADYVSSLADGTPEAKTTVQP